ncbi:nuclear transport factor 2 family protein [Fodinibius salsisoli]|uniref:SnoaL-like domain-containing protein n=1 Tax=Fodinibius salsisoli TaxID=2820877 RepID=A0ABT3PRG7_9BACT|nr:nuclear transport factor 2 family protein [Fodinibius salsisoli]MCW9708458.1 hypothetical protein [Fodinibius salsisoli]
MTAKFYPTAFIILLLTAVAIPVHGQETNPEEAVLNVVQTLFDAMDGADSAKAASVFAHGGHTFRVSESGDISLSDNEAFVQAIGNFKQEVVERMWDTEVLVDQNIAMAWMSYDLHANGKFSHCGTNLVSLIKTAEGWKISDITYNVKREECEESPLGPLTDNQ